MRLTRTGEIVSYEFGGSPVTGERGLLVIGPKAWEAVERVDVDTRLALGLYETEFAYWTDSKGRRWKAIRVLLTLEQYERIYPESRRKELAHLGDRARGRFYIHVSNWPHQLTGCVAIGRTRLELGVGESRKAMLEIFNSLGGWEEGRRIPGGLEVA